MEHGTWLTAEQADEMRKTGTILVPTVLIQRVSQQLRSLPSSQIAAVWLVPCCCVLPRIALVLGGCSHSWGVRVVLFD